MLSFGSSRQGREDLAAEIYVSASKYFGSLLAEGRIARFHPYFFADGQVAEMNGFFLLEGERESLDELRRDEEFRLFMMKAGMVVDHLRTHALLAGTEAGRQINLARRAREELGLE